MSISDFFVGTPGKFSQRSTLGANQKPLQMEQANAARGNFGQSSNYYKNLLSNNSADIQAFQEPEMRQFREQTIPGLAEQFAGAGAGGLSSSGFRNSVAGAGADLGERLARLRADLRQSSADKLNQMGQQSLGQYNENFYEPPTEGFLNKALGTAGDVAGSYIGGKLFSSSLDKLRNKGP